ncbi:D-alanyl-D-alanine carboxypeptidase family protein [Tissierella creatinophila]|uniref:serine-type D-Ala-D-Ala carboxypeptidase n=1 Tax=Tissierella creatinophila DSM 6911 TaxID=1123403 RepID=A0A1U7M9F6_TISCR|nr:D-alanyl-D-alanine carboxypeptidase family protein [Tissierella creatinophila]OLS03952.1 D-alanyl-D-alanine carboxypeptidase DacF precursor [Tissierella creatinophila DSM 6911]
MRKRLISFILITIMTMTSIASYAEIDMKSKSSLLMDSSSGKIIYAKNEHERLFPASITKIMTLLIVMESIENGKITLQDEVQISEHASKMGGTQVYLDAGEMQTVENLIKATSIRSANDAAVALSEYISGSEESFVKEMNKRAKTLKMKNTKFSNSSGLPIKNHYSTAYDIAIMSKELLKYEGIYKYLSTYMDEIKVGKSKTSTQSMVNTNKLIKTYDGANGVKTGFTNESLHCISASAKRGDLQLIAVVLGGETSKSRFEEAKKLLDYGFSNYESITIGKKGDSIATIPLEKGKDESVELVLERDSHILFSKGDKVKLEKSIKVPEYIVAPVEDNKPIGKLIIKDKEKVIDEINLIAVDDIEKGNFVNMFKKVSTNFLFNN